MNRALACAVVVCALGASLSAHPVATTTVSVVVDRTRHYEVTITSDADPMMAKLEALSSDPLDVEPALTRAARLARLDRLAPVLLSHTALTFDGTGATPRALPSELSDAGQVVLHLVGDVPAGARAMAWSSSLVYGSYPVAFRAADGHESVVWLQGPDRSDGIPIDGPSRRGAILRGVWLGFTHILPNGIDHILFVVGLFLLSTTRRQVLMQVTAFTVAHSLTLGMSLYGVFSLPAHVVEPLIALSVAYVGIENLMTSRLQPWRVLVVFGFGLLHGLGFAEALASLHLSRPEMLSTLVSFNVGVEAGQLSVILMAALALRMATGIRSEWRRPVVAFSSAAIGVTGFFWMIQRVL